MSLLIQSNEQLENINKEYFSKTIAKNFNLLRSVEKSKSISKPDLREFLEEHPDGKAKIWALSNKPNSNLVFSKLSRGDIVIFHDTNLICGYGSISSKIHWPNNHYIWPSGEDFDFIYSFETFSVIPEAGRVSIDSLRQLFPQVGNLFDNYIDLENTGIRKSDVIKHLQITPPYIRQNYISPQNRGVDEPPILGETFTDRKSIWKAFGGQWQQRIITFPSESTVNVFSDENGPYPDFKDSENGVIEYRGSRLRGGHELVLGNKLLEDARLKREPVRYWHRIGGQWKFKSWVIVVDRTKIVVDEIDYIASQSILWFLVPVPSIDPSYWPLEISNLKILELPATANDNPRALDELLKDYFIISAELELESKGKIVSTDPRSQYKRRKLARDLVIARSRNTCEYDKCNGMPPDVNRQGQAILQVDHIQPLAERGADVPRNMIALCPNCHSAKTFGLHSDQIIKRFRVIVERIEKLLS